MPRSSVVMSWAAVRVAEGASEHLEALQVDAPEVLTSLGDLVEGRLSWQHFALRVTSVAFSLRQHICELLSIAMDVPPSRFKMEEPTVVHSSTSVPLSIEAKYEVSAQQETKCRAGGGGEDDSSGVAGRGDDAETEVLEMTDERMVNGKARMRLEWSEREEAAFLKGLKLHGRDWGEVSRVVKTRNRTQLRTHYRYLAEAFSRNRERAQLGKEPARRVGHRGRPRSESTIAVIGEGSPGVATQAVKAVMNDLSNVILEMEANEPLLGAGIKRRPTRTRANPVPGEGLLPPLSPNIDHRGRLSLVAIPILSATPARPCKSAPDPPAGFLLQQLASEMRDVE